jgi:hypothetical protein
LVAEWLWGLKRAPAPADHGYGDSPRALSDASGSAEASNLEIPPTR